jgi:hypothetical protein
MSVYTETSSGGSRVNGSALVAVKYNGSASGGVRCGGCPDVSASHIYITTYGEGDIVYNIYKARKGVLEKIVIREILTSKMSLTGGLFQVMYKDTLNALWNEDDLITLEDAQAFAEVYYEDLLRQMAELHQNCQS